MSSVLSRLGPQHLSQMTAMTADSEGFLISTSGKTRYLFPKKSVKEALSTNEPLQHNNNRIRDKNLKGEIKIEAISDTLACSEP